MPQVVIGAAASAVLAGFAEGFTMAVLGKAFLGSIVLGGISRALTPKPKKNASPVSQVTSNTFTVRQSDTTHKHVYGLTRFTDSYAQIVSTGANGQIHAIIILCYDEIESIDEVWVNDYPVPNDHLDSLGNVTQGRYAGKLRIRKHLGSSSQEADPVAVAEIPEWTEDHRGQNVSYLFVTLTKDQDIYPNGMPNFSAIGKWRKVFDPRIGRVRWTPNIGLMVYDLAHKAEFGYQAEPDDISETNIASTANKCDEIVDTLAVDMGVSSIDTSTNILTLSGSSRLLFEICDRVNLVTAGTPPGGLATSTDYYVIPYQIKDNPRIKLATSLDNAIDGIVIDISSAGSGSFIIRKTGEPRYHGAGVIDTADTHEDNINTLLNAMAGRAPFIGGAWRFLPGVWIEPELELGLSDKRGAMSTDTAISMSERFNTVSGVFISQLNDYQAVDYPGYRNNAYIQEDNGREYPRDFPLPFTPRPTTAKRIAKLEVLKAREEIAHSAPFSMKAMQAQVGDNIMLTLERRGWEQKPFEITHFGFSINDRGDNVELITNLTLRETGEAIYEWASSNDDPETDLIPNTNFPNAFDVDAPTGLAFSSRAVSTVDNDILYTLVLSWEPHPDAFVTNNGFFEIQFKLSADDEWRPSFYVPGSLTLSDVLVSSVNLLYDLRIRALNNLGVRSGWNTIQEAQVGSSGGVATTNNWQGVFDSVSISLDWEGVADAVGATEDWGDVV